MTNSTSTNAYMRCMPYVLLASAWAILFGFCEPFLEVYTSNNLPKANDLLGLINQYSTAPKRVIWREILQAVGYAIPQMAVLTILAHHFGRTQAGIVSSGLLLIGVSINAILLTSIDESFLFYLLSLLLLGLPYVVWAMMLNGHYGNPRTWIYLLIAPGLTAFSANSIFTSFYGLDSTMLSISKIGKNPMFTYPLVVLLEGIIPIILMVLLSESYQRLVVQNRPKWNPRKIELNNYWKDPQAWLLFVAFRLGIFVGCMGFIAVLYTGVDDSLEHLQRAFTRHSNPALILRFISGLALLLFLLYCYRKFLLEYFFQKGKTPSYMYYFLQWPFVNMILFPAFLMPIENVSSAEQKEVFDLRNEPSENKIGGFRALMIVMQALMLIFYAYLLLVKTKDGFVIFHLLILAGFTFNILYIFYRPMIWAVFFWNLLLVIVYSIVPIVLGHDPLITKTKEQLILLLHPIYGFLWTFSTLFILEGVLHSKYFEADAPVAESSDEQV
jgi:hypothetical protein